MNEVSMNKDKTLSILNKNNDLHDYQGKKVHLFLRQLAGKVKLKSLALPKIKLPFQNFMKH